MQNQSTRRVVVFFMMLDFSQIYSSEIIAYRFLDRVQNVLLLKSTFLFILFIHLFCYVYHSISLLCICIMRFLSVVAIYNTIATYNTKCKYKLLIYLLCRIIPFFSSINPWLPGLL